VSAQLQAAATARAAAQATAQPQATSNEALPRDRVVTMHRTTHTPSGLQEALRSSGKGSWKFALLPLGLGLLILIVMLAIAFSSR
jgi:hypothetical protein